MKTVLQILLLLSLAIFNQQAGKATHIVGGEMNYTCLGNDQYEITLTIFRDCYNGNPNAWFDDPADIGIYNSAMQLVDSLEIDLINNDTLNPLLSSECLVVPPNVCVHTTTYKDTITLEWIPGGYELRYQRCCRNQTIQNIVDPLDAGATYGVTISETALAECNSSAKFQAWPPIYICVNEPIIFDQSAIDVDGDSIVYSLCTPLLGASPDSPRPNPWEQTTPVPVVWDEPTFSLDNVLGGVPLSIDPNTGLLTGVPNLIGQFVVGICLEEYRDGVLISTTRRDFQYNVGVCGETISSFFAPEVQCDGLTVDFDNESLNANEYIWFFNDPANPGTISTETHPSYSYPDTGLYNIMLIAEPGNICVDTAYQSVYLQFPSLFADFEYEFESCTDSFVVSATDLSFDTISTPSQWEWQILNEDNIILTSGEQNPTFVIYESGIYQIEMTVIAENGCMLTVEDEFEVQLIDVELFSDSVLICLGDSIPLNPAPNTAYSYSWSPVQGLDNPTTANPMASPMQTTNYTATIFDDETGCTVERTITIEIPEPITVELPADVTTCDPIVELVPSTNVATEYFWANDADINDIFAQTPTITVEPFGSNTYYLLVRDSFGCPAFDSVTIIGNGINVSAMDLTILCDSDSAQLFLTNNDPVDILTYNWTPSTGIVSGGNTATPIVSPAMPGTFTYYVALENQFDCTLLDSVTVGVIDTTMQLDFVSDLQCAGYSINFTNTSINAPYYLWDFGDDTNPQDTSTATNPTYVYPDLGNYSVMLTINADIPCKDTIWKEVTVIEPMIEVDFGWNYESCGDSLVLAFNDLSTNSQSTITDWNWAFSNNQNSDDQNPQVVVYESQILEASLTILSDDGCVDTLLQIIPLELITVDIADSVALCLGDSVGLNPGANDSYEYLWSPVNGLDNPISSNPMASPSMTTTYQVTILDYSADTCQIERSITVFVPEAIELSLTNDTIICNGNMVLMAESPQAVSYQWFEGNTVISNADTAFVEVERPSQFVLEVSDSYGCIKTDSVEIYNYSVGVIFPDGLFICENDTTQISPFSLFPDDELTYTWTPSNEIVSGSNEANPIVNPIATTTYTANVSNQYGCETTGDVLVTVLDLIPELTVSANPDTIVEGESSQLLANFDNYTYEWSPSATLSANDIYNPIATPLETTVYTLDIEDQNGCNNTAQLSVFVYNPRCEEPFIFLPNAFTPNGDMENDVLYLLGNGVEEMTLIIYNRWGQKMFETNDQSIGWDGTYKGEALGPDTYGYYLEVLCIDGNRFQKKGSIHLLK